MHWRFECYNSTIWEAPSQMALMEALALFKKVTGLHEMDIKLIKDIT